MCYSRQLMPPPSLPVTGARPRMEERGMVQGPVGKGLVLRIDSLCSQFLIVDTSLHKLSLDLLTGKSCLTKL